jgi:anaerobic magnesium-protoporphyrin IX monomethyl ester cyclase
MTKKLKMVFVNLPYISVKDINLKIQHQEEKFNHLSFPMGILYLSSMVKQEDICDKIDILDYQYEINHIADYQNINDFIVGTVEKRINYIPDVIAVSLMFTTSYEFFIICIEKLKEIWPHSKIIVGSFIATNCTQQLLENENVDYILRGEGEIGLPLFLNHIASSSEVKVKGIYSRDNIMRNYFLELCDNIENLDEIPFPDWGLIKIEKYLRNGGRSILSNNSVNQPAVASVITSRGCPFDCTFCTAKTVFGRKIRFRSIENIILELSKLHSEFDVTQILFEDDLFTANKKRTIELVNAIKALDITDLKIQFPNGLHVNSLDNEVIDALVDVGMASAHIAIESGCSYVLKNLMKKNVDLNKAKNLVKYIRNTKKLHVWCYFVLGMPGETREQIIETIEYAKQIKADWCNFFIATPLIGSEIYEKFLEKGHYTNDISEFKTTDFTYRSFDTDEITADELNDLTYRANLEVNFINNTNIVEGNYNKAIDQFNHIISHYPFHIFAYLSLYQCYTKLNNKKEAEKIKFKIRDLLKSDKRSKEMYSKYNDLIPKDLIS